WCVAQGARYERGSIEPHQDLSIADSDLLDKGSHALAKLEGSQRDPALCKLCRTVEHFALGRGVKAERRDGTADFLTGCEEHAQAIKYQPLDVARRNAPPLGCSERLPVMSSVET